MPTPPQNVIAVVFDYDRTLSPHHMQEDTVLRRFGVDPKDFWAKSDRLLRDPGYDNELAWMTLLLEIPGASKLSNADLRAMGRDLVLFPGLPQALAEMKSLLRSPRFARRRLKLEFYVVTSGLGVIVEGSALAPHLRAVLGCEYDERRGRLWRPRRTVSHTGKTQMLFRINKNLLDRSLDVNVHMPDEVRRVPFPNMIYVGDGPTDVPCFRVVMNYGGQTLAVHDPADPRARERCLELLRAKRVHDVVPADYRPGSLLRRTLERMIARAAAGIVQRPRRS